MWQGITSSISPQVRFVWLGLNLVRVRFSYNRNPNRNLILTKPNQLTYLALPLQGFFSASASKKPYSATLLDHMYSNMTNQITNRGILTFDVSDHLPTFCCLGFKSLTRHNKQLIRDMKHFDRENFLDDINNLVSQKNNCFVIGVNCNADTIFDEFLHNFSKAVDAHVPLRTQTRKELQLSNKPWINKGILRSTQKKNAMFKLCYKKNDSTLIDTYKKYSNVLTSVKRTAKQNYYYAMIKMNKQNFSKQWQLINQILQRNGKQKHSIRKLITDENAILTDEKEICDELNSFFVNIGPNMASKISTNNSSEGSNIHSYIELLPKSFFCTPCTEKEVYLELMKLNEKKPLELKIFRLSF